MRSNTIPARWIAAVEARPEAPLFTWVSGDDAASWTRREAFEGALGVLGGLTENGLRAGDRVVLAHAPGPGFFLATAACMLGGLVAVSVYPPDPRSLRRSIDRVTAVARVCRAGAVLADRAVAWAAKVGGLLGPRGVRWIAQESLGGARGVLAPPPREDDEAVIQFTSGSTREPRGVVLTHGNLASQLRFNREALGLRDDARSVLWVPPYHDLGLVSGMLSCLWGNGALWMTSPLDFLRDPGSWFELMHRVRATHTAAPDFAFALSTARTTPARRAAWDLSSLEVVMSAAEPIRAQPMDDFFASFAVSRLRREAFMPAYGLAEHTVGVTIGRERRLTVDRASLERDRRAAPPLGDLPRVTLVGCGPPGRDIDLRIVDPTRRTELPPHSVGEIWVRSASKAPRYEGDPDATRRDLEARLEGDPRGWLRTGDLGFVEGGELFVTGRLKETLIVRGRNYAPHDLESLVRPCHAAVRPGGVAAFAWRAREDGEERVGLFVEVRAVPHRTLGEVFEAAQRALSVGAGLRAGIVVVGRKGLVPKTSSGKVRRLECARIARARGDLPRRDEVLAVYVDDEPTATGDTRTRVLAALQAVDPALAAEAQGGVLRLRDSLHVLELSARIEASTGARAPVLRLLDGMTLDELVTSLNAHDEPTSSRLVRLRAGDGDTPWFLFGGAVGGVLYLRELADALPGPVYAVVYPGADGREASARSVEALAETCAAAVQGARGGGAVGLLGHSFGGLVAFEVARRLSAQGATVAHLVALDTHLPDDPGAVRNTPREGFAAGLQRALARSSPGAAPGPLLDLYAASTTAAAEHTPAPWDGPITAVWAAERLPDLEGWSPVDWSATGATVTSIDAPGDHFTMVRAREARAWCERLSLGAPAVEALPSGLRFDLLHPSLLSAPYPAYAALRAGAPVHRSPLGLWVVSRYDDVAAALRDPRLSSDARAWCPPDERSLPAGHSAPSILSAWIRREQERPIARLVNAMMVFLDRPDHRRIRAVLHQVFSPRAVEAWRPVTRAAVGELLDGLSRRGEADLVADFALPLPVRVIARLLGLPEGDTPRLLRWADALVRALDPLVAADAFCAAEDAVPEVVAYVTSLVDARAACPSDDLLSAMIRAHVEGERLTHQEVVANAVLLFVAGFETTTSMVGNALLALDANRAERDWLLAHPEAVGTCVEELVRFDGPFRYLFRTAVADVELAGHTLRAGDPVLLLPGSANRDERVWEAPDRLDFQRPQGAPHVGFGLGPHTCLGAALARVELQEALPALLQRFPRMRVHEVTWRAGPFRGPERMRVSL